MAMWLADPQFLAVDRAALGKPWVARARRRMPVYSWTIRTAERARASPGSGRRAHLGSRWPTANPKSSPRLASGVSRSQRRCVGPAWRAATRSSAMPFCPRSRIRAASDPAPAGRPRRSSIEDDERLARRRARLSQGPQPGRICVRPWLGRGVAARGRRNIIPSCRSRCRSRRCRVRGCSGIGRSSCSPPIEAVTVQNGLSSAHITFIDEAGRGGMRAARLADPSRHPISLVQPRLCELRRLPRDADQPQAQGHPQGARGRARRSGIPRAARRRHRRRRVGRDVGVLPGHRLAQVGPALSHPRILRPDRRAHGRPHAAVPRLPRRTADRRRAQLHRRRTRFTAAIGGASRRCRSSISSFAIIRRSNGRSSTASSRVQAGAQGEHKIARGYEPVITRSAHFIPEPRLPRRGRGFPRRPSATAIANEVEWLRQDLPYRSSSSRIDPRPSGRSASAMPRYIAGVVKPQAASPFGATAISPPLPPSACDVGEHVVERLLQRLAAEPHPLGQLVRGDGADEIFARAGRRDRRRAVVGIGAGADQRRIADPAPALGGQPAGRGRGGDMAVDDRPRRRRPCRISPRRRSRPRPAAPRAGGGARASRTSCWRPARGRARAANRSAPSPDRKTCGPCSISRRARLIGARVVRRPATAPARAVAPVHDRGVELDAAVARQHAAAPGVEAGIFLEHARPRLRPRRPRCSPLGEDRRAGRRAPARARRARIASCSGSSRAGPHRARAAVNHQAPSLFRHRRAP